MNQPIDNSQIIPAVATAEGAGVTVYRTIGTSALNYYDPFMLLDQFNSNNPDEYIAGFPSHPHRGFSTFTYMIDGKMEHKDSMGNTGNLGPGSAQLMKAASGIIHSEMPKQEDGLMSGFQLWINLPAANKMDDPEYQEFPANSFPVVDEVNYKVKILIGRYGDTHSPIIDDVADLSYLDVNVKGGEGFQHSLPQKNNSFLYLFKGSGKSGNENIPENSLFTLNQQENKINFHAGEEGARFIVVSGLPINEPISRYGPFVMNTRDEINQAMSDFQSNNFVR
ncbi:MAG: pirin family protein, partial [Proteobacteria bacterium]|nr:pirin family protein [Pseudomonadota bacterium]